ncbi:large subunit ribosomal protein L13Ae [Pancytospora epiphaga]|nr:large subunit ribosomal protein L13Ae [Pancytospora epiphaga]
MDKSIIIDGTGHVAGKLAAFVAKRLLKGYSVTILAVESTVFTGPLHRHIGKYKSFKEKRAPYNPERGSFHWSEPSKYFKNKLLRGMVARKTKRGAKALEGLTCFEGIPKQFENVERFVIPKALHTVTADCSRPSCTLGELLSKFGWHHAELASSLTAELRKREDEAREVQKEKDSKVEAFRNSKEFVSEAERRLAEFA